MQFEESLSIGRTASNDIVLIDEHVSSFHARLIKTSQALVIEDMGSRNGTYVNGEKIQKRRVRVGDSVTLSKYVNLDWNHPAIVQLLGGGVDPIGESSFSIGRASSNDMQVAHLGVEDFHVKLSKTDRGIKLDNLSNLEGTFVEGVSVSSVHVRKGMKVLLGHHYQLNWRDPRLATWLRPRSNSYDAGKNRKALTSLWIAGGIVTVLLVLIFSTALSGGGYSSSGIAEPGKTTRIGIDGIIATIPGDAVSSPVEISVAETQPESQMEENVFLETPVFTFTDPGSVFQSDITVDIDFDYSLVQDGRRAFPAYWDAENEHWVQVFAAREEGVLNVTTNHLSSWSVISVQQTINPLTTLLPIVTDAAFSPVGYSWEYIQEDYAQIMSNQEIFFGHELSPVDVFEASGSVVTTILLGGHQYSILPTSIPLRPDADYSGFHGQPGIQDNQGQWVTDQTVIFDVLYAYNCQLFLERTDTQRMADTFQQAADDLQSMYFWHNAAGALDALMIVLSEVLSHGATAVPFSVTELFSTDVISAIEGVICRAEMIRFGNQLERISSELRNYNAGELSDTEVVLLITEVEDAYNRIDPLANLSRSTFPAYEENWFEYTAERVCRDLLGPLLRAGENHLASLAQSSTANPAMLLAASEMLGAGADMEKAVGILQVLTQILNLQGDNPLVQYYQDTHDFEPSFVHTYNIAKDMAYWDTMVNQGEPGINVNSTPAGATIYFDGANTGLVTPALIENVEVGNHHIRLYMQGYNEFNVTFNMSDGASHLVNARMEEPTPPLPVFDLNLSSDQIFNDNVITVSGTVELEDNNGNITSFRGSSAILTVNGADQEIPVSGGFFSQEISIPSGSSIISLRANSYQGDTGLSTPISIYGDFSIPDIEVTLTWNTPTADIDLHVWNPRGEHSDFTCLEISDGFLDIDDTEGWGPETFTSEDSYSGAYIIKVNSYSLDQESYSDASITIYVNGTVYGTYGPHRFNTDDGNGSTASAWWEVDTVMIP